MPGRNQDNGIFQLSNSNPNIDSSTVTVTILTIILFKHVREAFQGLHNSQDSSYVSKQAHPFHHQGNNYT